MVLFINIFYTLQQNVVFHHCRGYKSEISFGESRRTFSARYTNNIHKAQNPNNHIFHSPKKNLQRIKLKKQKLIFLASKIFVPKSGCIHISVI